MSEIEKLIEEVRALQSTVARMTERLVHQTPHYTRLALDQAQDHHADFLEGGRKNSSLFSERG